MSSPSSPIQMTDTCGLPSAVEGGQVRQGAGRAEDPKLLRQSDPRHPFILGSRPPTQRWSAVSRRCAAPDRAGNRVHTSQQHVNAAAGARACDDGHRATTSGSHDGRVSWVVASRAVSRTGTSCPQRALRTKTIVSRTVCGVDRLGMPGA